MSELQDLFEKDPLSLTKDNRATIIARLREARGQFLLGDKTAGKIKTKPASKSPTELLNLDLSDLDFSK